MSFLETISSLKTRWGHSLRFTVTTSANECLQESARATTMVAKRPSITFRNTMPQTAFDPGCPLAGRGRSGNTGSPCATDSQGRRRELRPRTACSRSICLARFSRCQVAIKLDGEIYRLEPELHDSSHSAAEWHYTSTAIGRFPVRCQSGSQVMYRPFFKLQLMKY
jgi:hypothetical protein